MNITITSNYTKTMTHPVTLGLEVYNRMSREAIKEDAIHIAGSQEKSKLVDKLWSEQ